MKHKRRIFGLLLAFLLTVSLANLASAYSDYSEVFLPEPIDGTTRWVAPLVYNAQPYYSVITSKWNEQRNVNGTSPHVGIDCSISQTSKVIAVASGYLSSDSTGSAYNSFSLNTNHPTKNVYCHYEHCVSVSPSGNYAQGDQIATAGNYGTQAAHLHFAAYNTPNLSTRKGYRNETLYRNTSTWNYGRNCDTFSQVQFNNGTTAQVTLVFSGAGNYHTEKPSQAQIYYRVHGTTVWNGPYNMTNSSGYNYTYNFSSLVSSGTTIDWVVRYRRSSPASYMWAPAKFYNPSSNPNGSTQAWGYVVSTLGY